MISWWNSLGIKGKFYFFGLLDLAANLGIYWYGYWFSVLTFSGVGLITLSFLFPKSWDE